MAYTCRRRASQATGIADGSAVRKHIGDILLRNEDDTNSKNMPSKNHLRVNRTDDFVGVNSRFHFRYDFILFLVWRFRFAQRATGNMYIYIYMEWSGLEKMLRIKMKIPDAISARDETFQQSKALILRTTNSININVRFESWLMRHGKMDSICVCALGCRVLQVCITC